MTLPIIETFAGFLVGFVLGCLAADVALRRKTGMGIEYHLLAGKNNKVPETIVVKTK